MRPILLGSEVNVRMSKEEPKALVSRLVEEGFNTGDLALFDELYSQNFIDHNPLPGQSLGRNGVKRVTDMLRCAFPDLRWRIEDLLAEGNKVLLRMTAQGTHHGTFYGLPPTGRRVTISSMDLFRIAGGRIVERWGLAEFGAILHLLSKLRLDVDEERAGRSDSVVERQETT